MFLAKNSVPLGPNLLLRTKNLVKDLRIAALRHSHSDGSEKKKCFKYRPSNVNKQDCAPPKVHVPKFYRQLKPCKTDRQLARQHPKYLGVYGRCDIPYKPQLECMDPCDEAVRADDTMYRPSASLNKTYAKYWVECNFRKQKRCCRRVPPERSYRVQNVCAGFKMRCPPTLNPMPCRPEEQKGKCPKFTLCNCPPLLNTKVNCRIAPRMSRCRRWPCMYPSFSECNKEELNTLRPTECRCLDPVPMCVVFKHLRNRKRGPCDPLDEGFQKC